MITKLSLSLVSKLFHELADEYLYEIIQLRSFHHIRPLVDLLRLPCLTNAARTKGWWCRRLEVDVQVEYQWSWGCISIWGLATACPGLTDLRCSLRHGPSDKPGTQPTYPVSLPLAQILANQFGSSLRHLKLGGHVAISVRLANRLLSHMSSLEVCRLAGLQPVSDTDIERGACLPYVASRNSTPSDAMRTDIWDDEEINVPRLPHFGRKHDDYGAVAGQACWPSTTEQVISLPHLQDLRMSPILSLVHDWKLPHLRHATDSFFGYRWDDHDHIHALLKGLKPHYQSITQFTFQGSNIQGIWLVVGHLPVLQHLRFTTMYGFQGSHLTKPHLGLRIITLFRGDPISDAIAEAMDNVFLHAKEEKLPKLRTLRVWGTDGVELVEDRRATCELLQLALDVRDIEWGSSCN